MCDSSPKAECVPAFTHESERGPFVREAEKQDEKRLGDKIYGGSFAGFFSSAGVEGSQRTGKCMYIKVWRNKRNFTDSTKLRCGRGKAPCFAVCALVCDFSPKVECVKGRFSFRLTAPYSEERRRAASEAAKAPRAISSEVWYNFFEKV